MRQIIIDSGKFKKQFTNEDKIDHIGIHAAPGSKFQINENGTFLISGTGVFEINLEGKGSYIYSIECLENLGSKIIIDCSGKGVGI